MFRKQRERVCVLLFRKLPPFSSLIKSGPLAHQPVPLRFKLSVMPSRRMLLLDHFKYSKLDKEDEPSHVVLAPLNLVTATVFEDPVLRDFSIKEANQQ